MIREKIQSIILNTISLGLTILYLGIIGATLIVLANIASGIIFYIIRNPTELISMIAIYALAIGIGIMTLSLIGLIAIERYSALKKWVERNTTN